MSLFEWAVKSASKNSGLVVDLGGLQQALIHEGVVDLALVSSHAMGVALLPPIHKDPFDRLLLAQAVEERSMLLTVDGILLRYPTNVLDGC